MIINWLKNKFSDFPIFYQNYLKEFENKFNNEFVIFDIITSEGNINKIVALKINNQKIIVKDFFDVTTSHDNIIVENHVIEEEALIRFLSFIKNIPLVSYKINEKIEIMNLKLHKMKAGKVENELFSIELLFQSLEQKIDLEKLTIEFIAQRLKLDKFQNETILDKLFLESLIFIKLNSKIKLEKYLDNMNLG